MKRLMPSYFMGGQSRSVLLIKELSFFLFGSFFTADKNVIFRFYNSDFRKSVSSIDR